MNYDLLGFIGVTAFGMLAIYLLNVYEEKKYPVDKVCPKCPPELKTRHNYLTTGGICQECAWKELADEKVKRIKDGDLPYN